MIQQLKPPPGWVLNSAMLRTGPCPCKLSPVSPAGCGPSNLPKWLWLHKCPGVPKAQQVPDS